MKKKLTVFITGAGTVTAISVIKGLKQQQELDITICTADAAYNVAGRFFGDYFFKLPPASDPSFIKVLKTAIKKSRADILIPIIDYEFTKIASHKQEFLELGCTPIISDVATIEKCIDKFKIADFFSSVDLKVPISYSKEEIKKINNIKFPLFIKPSYLGRSTINSHKLENKKDLDYYVDKVKAPIIQEFIDGTEITIDGINDLQGNFIAAVPRIRIETKTGLSVKGETIKDTALIKKIKIIAEKLRIIGAFNVQCIKNKKNEYVFIEINPRFAGGHPLTIQAGLNSAYILCKCFLKQPIEKKDIEIKKSVSMIRFWDEVFLNEKGKGFKPQLQLFDER